MVPVSRLRCCLHNFCQHTAASFSSLPAEAAVSDNAWVMQRERARFGAKKSGRAHRVGGKGA